MTERKNNFKMEKIKINNSHSKKLLKSVLDRELNIITTSIKLSEKKLKSFEKTYKISSNVFFEKYKSGLMGDDPEIMLWAAEVQILNRLKADQKHLAGVRFVN